MAATLGSNNAVGVTTGNTAGFYEGMPITGNPNIPAGATVASILGPNSFTINTSVVGTAISVVTAFGTNVVNGAIAGDLTIGNQDLGGLGNSVVQLGGHNQIADTSVIHFDSGPGCGLCRQRRK